MIQDKWKIYNRLNRRRNAYRQLFLGDANRPGPNAARVLKDLRKFCKDRSIMMYNPKMGTMDPIAMANANGRREVYDRIMRYLYLNDDAKVQLETQEDEDAY